jgi:hypothetical protein
MHMWHHVTNHLIIFNDKDSNSENRIKLRVRDTVEDVSVKTEVEVVDPNSYLTLNAPLTRHKRKRLLDDQPTDPHRQRRRVSSTIAALPLSLSASKRMAITHRALHPRSPRRPKSLCRRAVVTPRSHIPQ